MTKPLTGKDVGAALGSLIIGLRLTDPPAFVAKVCSWIGATTKKVIARRTADG